MIKFEPLHLTPYRIIHSQRCAGRKLVCFKYPLVAPKKIKNSLVKTIIIDECEVNK